MAKAWYILQVYSGYEAKIEKTIRVFLERGEVNKEVLIDIKVPAEEVAVIRDGKRRASSKKILPGYIMLEMDLPENNWKEVCGTIRKINGVAGFVGAQQHSKPQPISAEEARNLLQRSGEIKGDRRDKPRKNYETGEEVKIISGPFESFSGVIEEVMSEKSRLKVTVGIFGRNTPVEVDMEQVEKV